MQNLIIIYCCVICIAIYAAHHKQRVSRVLLYSSAGWRRRTRTDELERITCTKLPPPPRVTSPVMGYGINAVAGCTTHRKGCAASAPLLCHSSPAATKTSNCKHFCRSALLLALKKLQHSICTYPKLPRRRPFIHSFIFQCCYVMLWQHDKQATTDRHGPHAADPSIYCHRKCDTNSALWVKCKDPF